jgi:hypothetical protein
MFIVDLLNSLLKNCGAKLIRFPECDLSRRIKLLNHYEINKILDVGANDGGFANEMFHVGFNGKIISFEPLKSAFAVIDNKSKKNDSFFLYPISFIQFQSFI